MDESRVERGQLMKTRTNAYLPILLVLPALLAGCGQTSPQPAEVEAEPVQESQQETVRLQEEAEEEDTVILQEEETDTAVTALPLPDEEEGKAEVSVSEIFSKEGDALTQEGSEYHYAYHIPKIEDDTAAAAEINAKINSIYASFAEECYDSIQSREEPFLASITYETFQSGDVLSLLLSCTGYYDGYDSYDVFHYDTKKGECLENRDILSLSGMSDAEYGAALCRAEAAFFDDFCFPGGDLLNPDAEFYELRAQTLTYGNEDLSYPIWLDGDELHTIAKIASPAGEGFFFRDLLIRKEQETERKTAQLGDYLMAALQQDQVVLRLRQTERLKEILGDTIFLVDGDLFGEDLAVDGLYSSYEEIVCAEMGEERRPYVFLLTREGRVEAIDVLSCLWGNYFCGSGPILGISNGMKLVRGGDGSYDVTVLTEDGKEVSLCDSVFSLREVLTGSLTDSEWTGDMDDDTGTLCFLSFQGGNGEDIFVTASTGMDTELTSGAFRYLGTCEKGLVYSYRLETDEVRCGTIALNPVCDEESWDLVLLVTELGGTPLFGEQTGDETKLERSFG